MKLPRLAMVLWGDACGLDTGSSWVANEPTTWTPCLMRSVGFVVYDGPEGLVLTCTFSGEQIGPRNQIPRGMVRAVTELAPETEVPGWGE